MPLGFKKYILLTYIYEQRKEMKNKNYLKNSF